MTNLTLVELAQAITEGKYPQVEQDTSVELKSAPKIFRDACKIDWNLPSVKVRDFIRGLSPYPAAFTLLNDQNLKIFKVEKEAERSKKKTGEYETDGKNYFRFKTADGALDVLELQLQGKKRMAIQDFLRGNQV